MQGNTRWITAELMAVRDLTPDIRLFELVPSESTQPYEPGSHIDLTFEIGERSYVRSYSLIGRPDRNVYRIAVKRVAQSRGGSAWLHGLLPGARLRITPPANNFPLRFGSPSYLLIAGGIGITPLLGMAMALKQRGADFRMLYAARTRANLAFVDRLVELGIQLDTFVSDEGRRLDPTRELAHMAAGTEIYFCGPAALLTALQAELEKLEKPLSCLRFETFGSGGTQSSEPFWIRVPRLGLEIVVPEHQSMLEALEDAGVEVMAECRRGECGLCAVDVVALKGAIDHRDVFLSARQKEENHRICACVSRVVQGGIVIDTAWRPDQ